MLQKKEEGLSAGKTRQSVVPPDFCRIFAEDKKALYRLSWLLTAEAGLAEQCFAQGLEASLRSGSVPSAWARAWARRMIIESAVGMIAPSPVPRRPTPRAHELPKGRLTQVLGLPDFERFVFVMSVLEGFSLDDCSDWLDQPKPVVAAAKSRALTSLAAANPVMPALPGQDPPLAGLFLKPSRAA